MPQIKKIKPQITVEILEYMPNAVVRKTMIRKSSGDISISSFDAGEELAEQTLPYDYYIQIIEGAANLRILDKTYKIKLGEGIIIPANATHIFSAHEKFKMITSVIKNGNTD